MDRFADIIIANPFGSDYIMSSALFLWYLMVAFFIFLIVYGVGAYLLGRVFSKAGVPSWKAWVPVYNAWKFFQIGGYAGAWSLMPWLIYALLSVFYLCAQSEQSLFFAWVVAYVFLPITIVVFILMFLATTWSITRKLDKGLIYMLLIPFHFGPSLWLWILAFDKTKWNDKLGRKSIAPEMQKKK